MGGCVGAAAERHLLEFLRAARLERQCDPQRVFAVP